MSTWSLINSSIAQTLVGNVLSQSVSITGVQVGDLLLIPVVTNTSVSSIADNATGSSNNYFPIFSTTNTSGQKAILYGSIITNSFSGTATITVTFPGTSFPAVGAIDLRYSGLVFWATDGIASQGNISSQSPASGNITTTQNDLLISIVGFGASSTIAATGAWSLVNSANYSGVSYGMGILAILNAAPQTIQGTAHLGTSVSWSCGVVGLAALTSGPSSPIVVVPYVEQSAHLIHCLTVANAVSAPVSPLLTVTGVNSVPIFSKNGSAIPNIQGPFWPNSTFTTAFVDFQIPAATTISPTDILTYTSLNNWLTTAVGNAGAVTGAPVANYAGQLAPGFGTFAVNGSSVPVPGFNLTNAQRTMLLGYVAGWGAQGGSGAYYSLVQNWLHRGIWANVATVDQYGHPKTISAAASAQITNIGSSNLVDSRQTPFPTGIWTIMVDETNPSSPMPVSLTVFGPGYAHIINPSGRIAGTIINGIEVGVKWLFDFEYTSSNPSSWSAQLSVTVSSPTGTYPCNWTLQNEALVPPLPYSGSPNIPQISRRKDPYGTIASISVPGNFQLDQGVINNLTTPSGRGPAIMRYVDCEINVDGLSSENDNGDQQNQINFPWNSSGRQIQIQSIRNYNISNTPNVWFAEALPNTPALGGGPWPYAIQPANVGYLNWSGGSTQWAVGEIVTTAPHGLKNGLVLLTGAALASITFTNGGSSTVTGDLRNASVKTFVTSANSIAFTFDPGCTPGSGSTLPGGINNVVGTQNLSGCNIQVVIPDSGAIPYELAGAVSSYFQAKHMVNIPIDATDQLVAAIATSTLNSTAPGGWVIPEYGNENWSFDTNRIATFAYGAMNVLGTGPLTYAQFRIQQSWRFRNIFYNIFNAVGRGSEIKFSISGQWTNPGLCQSDLAYANSLNIPVDIYFVAPYYNPPGDSTLAAAFASIYYDQSASSQFGNAYPWTRQMALEYLRHHFKYSTQNNINTQYYPGFQTALATYVNTSSQPPGFIPYLYAYEASITSLCPNISVSDPTLQWKLAHDLFYDPNIVYLYDTYFASLQYGGIQAANCYNYCMGRQNIGSAACWGHTTWAGQTFGTGTGSDGKSVNQFWQVTGACQDFGNVSPMLLSARIWMDASSPAPPIPPSGPPTATLTGPATGVVGTASQFTISLSGLYTGIIALGDGNSGGTFSPVSLTYSGSSSSQSFTYTPAISGSVPISIFTNPPLPQVNSPIFLTVSIPPATSLTISGPSTGVAGNGAGPFYVTPNGLYTGTVTLSDSDGTFYPATLTWSNDSITRTFGYVPGSSGTKSLSITSSPALTYTGSPLTLTVAAAVGYTITGPASGTIGFDSAIFEILPASFVVDDLITLSDGGAGGFFRPFYGYSTFQGPVNYLSSVIFTNSNEPQYFIYHPKAAGTITITLTSARGGVVTGSPITYTCNNPSRQTPYSGNLYSQ
jgi:hypothetical protein